MQPHRQQCLCATNGYAAEAPAEAKVEPRHMEGRDSGPPAQLRSNASKLPHALVALKTGHLRLPNTQPCLRSKSHDRTKTRMPPQYKTQPQAHVKKGYGGGTPEFLKNPLKNPTPFGLPVSVPLPVLRDKPSGSVQPNDIMRTALDRDKTR